jgi:hypothetical protein
MTIACILNVIKALIIKKGVTGITVAKLFSPTLMRKNVRLRIYNILFFNMI